MKTKLIIGALVTTTVIAVTAATTFGVQLYLKNKSASDSNNSNQITQSDPYSGWNTFTNTSRGFEIKYPQDWKVTEENSSIFSNFKVVISKDTTKWTFTDEGTYTGGQSPLSNDFFSGCQNNEICEVQASDLQINKTFTSNKITKKKSLVSKSNNQILESVFSIDGNPDGILGSTGISQGYFISYTGDNLTLNSDTLDLMTKSLVATDNYMFVREMPNSVQTSDVHLITKTTDIRIAEGSNPILDKDHKTVIFNNLGSQNLDYLGNLYFYDIASGKITSKSLGGRVSSAYWDKTQTYLLVGNGVSLVQEVQVFKYDTMALIGKFTYAGNSREIKGQIYYNAVYTLPKRNDGKETNPNSIGISKFDLATGKITAIKVPTATNDFNIDMLDENGNLK